MSAPAANTIRPISADSHVSEPPDCFTARIDPKYRDVAPHVEYDGKGTDLYVINGMSPIPMGLVAAAGKDPKQIRLTGVRFDDMHRGGWEAKARVADQERDGIAAEIVYPTVGMMICNHKDYDYKNACMRAYNEWLREFQQGAPDRIYGAGMTAMRSVAEGIGDLERIKEMGFRAVMLPGDPAVEDYDSLIYEPFFRSAVELKLPLSFHILTSTRESTQDLFNSRQRGGRLNHWNGIIRGVQDIIGLFIFGGVFDRHPDLKVVCVEADAGWAPHFMYRMDHAYNRHRHWMQGRELKRMPSEYFRENIYLTFQDDWTAFQMAHLCNPRRLLWANDFPHSDSTWPESQELLAEHTRDVSPELKRMILRDNSAELYGITVQ
jgi:predicted TIM-barrel fold metal-dependent hydrolase